MWYRQLAALRASREEMLAGTWEELMADSELVFAFERAAGEARSITLANWTEDEVDYDAALVKDLELLAGSYGDAEAGKLRPLEAVVWGTK